VAIAFDAFASVAAGTGTLSWTHTPSGTPRGVMVFIVYAAGTNQVDSCDYGGEPMYRKPAAVFKTATEALSCVAYFRGASLPTGAQTVTVTVSGADSKIAGSITVTAAADVESADTGRISSDLIIDPSVILNLKGRSSFCCIGFGSGIGAVANITPFTNWTSRLEHDFGNQTAGIYTYNTIGTADVNAGWTQGSDDAVMCAIALTEILWGPWSSGGHTQPPPANQIVGV